MTIVSQVAVIGAGPYGLSVAAHLAARGIRPLVFGSAMDSWADGTPRGMRLKSDGFASNLSDAQDSFTLEAFCKERGLPYAHVGHPVPVGNFVAYGRAFQERFVEQLDPRRVVNLRRTEGGFMLRLEDGSEVAARRVVVATGIRPLKHVPGGLAGLPETLVSHTADHADYGRFAGREIAVVGAGASAIDAAAEAHRAGASVRLISRNSSFRFFPGGGRRTLLGRIMAPATPLGPGWRKLLCCRAPLLFRAMPLRFRQKVVRRFLGPAPGWFVRDEVEGKVAFQLSTTVAGARERDGRVELELTAGGGGRSAVTVDHVIAGTGYGLDVRRLPFLDPALLADLRLADDVPALSARFESSVPDLHFVGTLASFEFGPLLRFVCGAGFAARRVSAAIVRRERRWMRAASARPARSWWPAPAMTEGRQPA